MARRRALLTCAGDLASTPEPKTKVELKVVAAIFGCRTNTGLSMALQKSKAKMLIKRKNVTSIDLKLAGHNMKLVSRVKCMRAHFDQSLMGASHIKTIMKKARRTIHALAKTPWDVRRPIKALRRALLMSLSQLIALFETPVWFSQETKKRSNMNLWWDTKDRYIIMY